MAPSFSLHSVPAARCPWPDRIDSHCQSLSLSQLRLLAGYVPLLSRTGRWRDGISDMQERVWAHVPSLVIFALTMRQQIVFSLKPFCTFDAIPLS